MSFGLGLGLAFEIEPIGEGGEGNEGELEAVGGTSPSSAWEIPRNVPYNIYYNSIILLFNFVTILSNLK